MKSICYMILKVLFFMSLGHVALGQTELEMLIKTPNKASQIKRYFSYENDFSTSLEYHQVGLNKGQENKFGVEFLNRALDSSNYYIQFFPEQELIQIRLFYKYPLLIPIDYQNINLYDLRFYMENENQETLRTIFYNLAGFAKLNLLKNALLLTQENHLRDLHGLIWEALIKYHSNFDPSSYILIQLALDVQKLDFDLNQKNTSLLVANIFSFRGKEELEYLKTEVSKNSTLHNFLNNLNQIIKGEEIYILNYLQSK